jgi:hypothetical protein
MSLGARDLPWQVNLSAYDAATGVVRGTVSHIQLTLSGHGCKAVIDGTRATASNGRVRFQYTDSTDHFTVVAGGNLHFYDVRGCPEWNDGDQARLGATFTVSPKQAITSP